MPLTEQEINQVRALKMAGRAGYEVTEQGQQRMNEIIGKAPEKVFGTFNEVVDGIGGINEPFVGVVERPYSFIKADQNAEADIVTDQDPRIKIKGGEIKPGQIVDYNGFKFKVGGPVKIKRFIDPRDLDGSLALEPVENTVDTGFSGLLSDMVEAFAFPAEAGGGGNRNDQLPPEFSDDLNQLIEMGLARE